MAGQPNTRKILAALDAKLAKLDKITPGAEDRLIFDRWANGEGWKEISADLGMSRQMLDKWINLDPDRKKKKEELKRIRAEAKVEEGAAILEDLSGSILITGPEVQLATSRSKYKQWEAAHLDKEQFGDVPAQVNVNLSAGTMHLNALIAHGTLTPTAVPRLSSGEDDVPVLDAELIEECDVIEELSEA
jgi:hypothetical protein